jgi:hypothetical protein
MLIFLCAGTHSTIPKEDKQAADDSVYRGHEANRSNDDGAGQAAANPRQQQQKHGKECNHLNYEIPSTQRLCTKVIYIFISVTFIVYLG